MATIYTTQAAPPGFDEFPFELRDGLLWVKVIVNESKQPLNFLLDTGASVSVINLKTVRQMGLKQGRKVQVQGVQSTLNGYWPARMSAQVEQVRLPRKYLAVDLEPLSLSCARRVDGLVGADFFHGRVVQIDFDMRKIRLLARGMTVISDEILPLQLRPCGFRVPITVNGREHQWVRLDTGCATPLQWVTSKENPAQCIHKMAVGLTEISIPQTMTTVGIGSRQFEDVPTGLHEKALFPGEVGLLGNGLLSHFSKVTIDAKSGRLILEKRDASR